MKNTNVITALIFSALAAAVPLEERGWRHREEWEVTTTTILTTVYFDPGQGYPDARTSAAESTAQAPATETPVLPATATVAVKPNVGFQVDTDPATMSVSSSSSSTIANQEPTVAVEQPPANAAVQAPTTTAAVPSILPVPETSAIQASPGTTTSQTPATSSTVPEGSGGASKGNTGPSSGDPPVTSFSNVQINPLSAYASGAQFESGGPQGGCSKYPYYDRDPLWELSDGHLMAKAMVQAPEGIIDPYCGAIIEITGPDGRTTRATITDSCGNCYGPGGMDLLRQPWSEIGQLTTDNPVQHASWEIVGWAQRMEVPALT